MLLAGGIQPIAINMKRIRKALAEIEISLRKVDTFLLLIKTLVLLTVSYLLLFVLGIPTYYAFIPAIVYFISSLFVRARRDSIRRVEKKYSMLNEKLRTARDYQDKDNIVLDELEEDIMKNLKHVRVSAFFSYSRALILIVLLVLAVNISLFIASRDMKLIDLDDIMGEVMKRLEQQQEDEESPTADFTGSEVSIMEVGNERIKVEINPVGMDFDFNDVTEASDYEFSIVFPKDIFIASGAAYRNEFTEEQQALIKRYFDKKKE